MVTTYLNGPGTGLMVGGAPLLTGKFVPPTTSAVLVERPRLLRLLTAAAAEPLTLVCAPAGSGKTVLAASWAASTGPPGAVAWISLDDADDDDPCVFWPYLVMALVRAGVDLPSIGVPEAADLIDRSFL